MCSGLYLAVRVGDQSCYILYLLVLEQDLLLILLLSAFSSLFLNISKAEYGAIVSWFMLLSKLFTSQETVSSFSVYLVKKAVKCSCNEWKNRKYFS